MEQIARTFKVSLSEAVIIALLPICAYYAAYQYELGYYRAFQAPENLISVDMSTLLAFGSAILGLFILLYNVIALLRSSSLDKLSEMSWKRTSASILAIFLVLYLLFLLLYQSGWLKAILPAGSIALLLFISRFWHKTLPKWVIIFIILIALVDGICQGIGQYSARTQSKFTVIASPKQRLVIRKLGDFFLCVTYDPKSKAFIKSFEIIPIQSEGLILEYKEIGPLHFES